LCPPGVKDLSLGMKFSVLIFALVLTFPFAVLAQEKTAKHEVDIEIPEVALLALIAEIQSDVKLSPSSPVEAGNALDFSTATDKSIWINYSSILKNRMQKRKVIAAIEGELPAGMDLVVAASEVTGNGNGKLGEPVGRVKLSQQPSDIIMNIGSCYTGKGMSNGHLLTYQLEYDESEVQFSELSDEQTAVNVIYTLTDSN